MLSTADAICHQELAILCRSAHRGRSELLDPIVNTLKKETERSIPCLRVGMRSDLRRCRAMGGGGRRLSTPKRVCQNLVS